MSKVIAVFFGGKSNEHEISIITGTMAANVLKSGGDTVVPVYISQSGQTYTGERLCSVSTFKEFDYKDCTRALVANGGVYSLKKNGKLKSFISCDVALNCCHGGSGEGGGVCGLCAIANIPLASAGIFESAAFMDKYFTKLILTSLGVNVAPYAYIRSAGELPLKGLDFPLIVKPAKLGSSIGVELAENEGELLEAVESALYYDDGVIVEKYVENRREINCAAYFSEGRVITSECEEACSKGDILSYDDKYAGGGKSVLPADIPQSIAKEIRDTTALVYLRLNMRGIVRFDYLLDGDKVILSEINTVPGSLSYYLLSSGFKSFYPVLRAVIDQAEVDWKELGSKKILSTGILKNLPSNACKFNRK